MEKEIKLAFPKELVEEMNFETTIFPDNAVEVGVAIFSEIEQSSHTLRIVQILLDEEENVYHPIQELAAFSFGEREDLTSFINDLPELNGIEMLMLLNPPLQPKMENIN